MLLQTINIRLELLTGGRLLEYHHGWLVELCISVGRITNSPPEDFSNVSVYMARSEWLNQLLRFSNS